MLRTAGWIDGLGAVDDGGVAVEVELGVVFGGGGGRRSPTRP